MIRVLDVFAGLALAAAVAGVILYLLPASIWLEVRSMQVLDSEVDISPRMIVDRTISRPFQAEWTVTVLRVVPNGFVPACRAYGHDDYDPTNVLPMPLDLDWWTWPTQCDLPEGEYIARTVWVLKVFDRFEKSVRATSNLFVISPKGTQDGNSQGSAGVSRIQ